MAYKSKSRLLQIWSKLPVTKTASGYCHFFEYIIYCKHLGNMETYNCVDKYIRFSQQKATLTPAISDNARSKILEWWKEAYLEALVRIYPTIYLRELQALLAGDFNLAPRDFPTIARLLTALRISRKKCVHVATERFSPYNRHCRQLFFQWRRTIDPSRVHFFDETSFNYETDKQGIRANRSRGAMPFLSPKEQSSEWKGFRLWCLRFHRRSASSYSCCWKFYIRHCS